MTSRSNQDNPLLSAAREYAERGWPVFPLWPKSKVPVVPRGVLEATTDRNQIMMWWQAIPKANVAIATGAPVDVLDIDSKQSLPRLQDVLGTDWRHDGPVVITGKGRHLYFNHLAEARNRAGLFEGGVDYRGTGGYVVAPPSLHPSGNDYRWDPERDYHRELPEVPDVLQQFILQPRRDAVPRLRVGGLSAGDQGIEVIKRGGEIVARPNIFLTVSEVLKQAMVQHGQLWKTRCIFHDDNNPSMVLYPDDTFHCFSCEAHGDSFDLERGIDMHGKEAI